MNKEIERIVEQINAELEAREREAYIAEHGAAAWEEHQATKGDLVYEMDEVPLWGD